MNDGVVQDSGNDLQATGGGRLGDAVSSSDDVLGVNNGAGADVAGLGEEDPLDHTDLGELTLKGVHTTDNTSSGELRLGHGAREAHGHGEDRKQSKFHGAQLLGN